MPTPRKIPCAAALLVLATLALAATPAGAAGAPDRSDPPRRASQRLLAADLFQSGRQLVFTVRTARPVALASLWRQPDPRRAGGRYLCLALGRSDGGGRERLLCLGGRRPRSQVGLVLAAEGGRPERAGTVPAAVKRPRPDKLVVSFDPGAAGLRPDRYAWRAIASTGCEVRRRCALALPAEGSRPFRLRPVRAVGCTGGGPDLVSNGPRDRPLVALTFDDGPSDETPAFLDFLRGVGVPATFFEVGSVMGGREATMRRMLREGHEIGDHTQDHVEYPGHAQIAAAASRIEAATGFKPCLFRPPGGAVNGSVVATAGALGMTTVLWDVDPFDWKLPGSAAIASHILSAAHPGSIILMHDGGGPRGGTLAALPAIVSGLRARGYGFATVSELLGNRILYRPYG